MHVDRSGKTLLSDVLQRYVQDYKSKFSTRLGSVTLNKDVFAPRLHLSEPALVREYGERVYGAQRAIHSLPEGGGDVDDGYRPVIREALIWERLAVARRVEAHRSRTVDPELTEAINQQLEPLDRLISQRWLRETPEAIVPQLRDYFPLHDIEDRREPRERLLDEKFHILQAPSQFLPDLHEARDSGQLRGIACAVGYLDIDDFKRVNQEYGEPFVDLNILPRLMRTLEAHMYQRGHAYRFGGDEYALLMHNIEPDEASRLLEKLRRSIEQLAFVGTKPSFRVTASIGFVVIGPGCHLTGREIEARAAAAKQVAKSPTKNRIATYDAPWFDEPRIVTT